MMVDLRVKMEKRLPNRVRVRSPKACKGGQRNAVRFISSEAHYMFYCVHTYVHIKLGSQTS